MSIWSSTLTLDDVWEEHPPPLAYRGSHLWPQPDDRGGHLHLAAIPGFLTRDGYDDGAEDDRVWPWLRVSLIGAAEDDNRDTVVLDRDQVRSLRDELTDWLARSGDLS